MGKCAICGKETDKNVKVGSLSFFICEGNICPNKLIYEMEDAIPIVWLGSSDLSNHDSTTEIVLDRTMNDFNLMHTIATDASDKLFNDNMFNSMFDYMLDEAGENLEEIFINKLSLEDMLLFNINDLSTEKGKETYRNRVSSGK
jgi:hypothetical protein